jgi:hypothetical protein
MIVRGWLPLMITGYRDALATMNPKVESKVESMVAPCMGKR